VRSGDSLDLTFLVRRVFPARPAELRCLQLLLMGLLVLQGRVVLPLAFPADQAN